MNETMTISRAEYEEWRAMNHAIHFISGVLDDQSTTKKMLKIKLDLVAKQIEPFAIKRVKGAADVLASFKEVAND